MMPRFTIRQIVLTHSPYVNGNCAGCYETVRWYPEHVLDELEEAGYNTTTTQP